LAGKTNANASSIDKTSFWWTGLCGICHPGGGPTELDRDGELYFDAKTGQFGYEKLGKTAGDVTLDGDYAEVNTSTGALRAAPWDTTGVAQADCLLCHRADRTVNGGMNMNWIWRTATLRAKDKLVDSGSASVPAYAAASTAGQGWFSDLQMATTPPGKPPMASSLDIDYQEGVTNGSLVEKTDGLYVAAGAIAETPRDYACWGCHLTPDMKKRGREWFNPDSDVHYQKFNNLDDGDTGNDIMAGDSTACTYCHPAGLSGMDLNHNIAKGNATLGSVRNDTDYTGFRTCADCHLASSTDRDPNAPVPPSSYTGHNARHREILSCEACHVPSKATPADLVVDNSVTGSTVGYKTSDFLSADPLDPTDTDKSKWYPSFVLRADRDGVDRMFPVKLLLSIWWGDWDQNGTPTDKTDDVIKPIPLWRARQIISGLTVPADNKVNTLAEIYTYITALKGNDSHGVQVAANPVLVKGGQVWHDDGAGSVTSFEYHGTGIKTESSHPFSVNHNVRPGSEALGSTSCNECHNGGTPVFDRLILVDPFGPDGQPVYKTVRELLGVDPW
jgi:hypothetical protein